MADDDDFFDDDDEFGQLPDPDEDIYQVELMDRRKIRYVFLFISTIIILPFVMLHNPIAYLFIGVNLAVSFEGARTVAQ